MKQKFLVGSVSVAFQRFFFSFFVNTKNIGNKFVAWRAPGVINVSIEQEVLSLFGIQPNKLGFENSVEIVNRVDNVLLGQSSKVNLRHACDLGKPGKRFKLLFYFVQCLYWFGFHELIISKGDQLIVPVCKRINDFHNLQFFAIIAPSEAFF